MMNETHAVIYHASGLSFITHHPAFIISSFLVRLAWIIFYLWLAGGALTVFALARQKFLKPSKESGLKNRDAPLVSVLVPARNEERRCLRRCVRSILAQEYANFEVVAVNDRSTDSTGAILHALAAEDERLRVFEGQEMPAGWLGKPFALQQALEASRGSWVLATDADIIFDPAALRTALDYAFEHDCDALTFWERISVPMFSWFALLVFPTELTKSTKTPLALGVGGFYLIRRAALERIGGFGAVRAEVLDDVRLAEQLKRDGARTRAEYAPRLVSTRMYASFPELWEGLAKNSFAIMKFSPALTLLLLAWVFLVAILPPALAVASGPMWALNPSDAYWQQLFVPSFLTWLLVVALHMAVNVRCRIPAVYALTAPLGWLLSSLVMLGSAYGVLTGRGLVWKGRRFYESGGVRPPRATR
jgi:chlorobactene glucosyltransferase